MSVPIEATNCSGLSRFFVGDGGHSPVVYWDAHGCDLAEDVLAHGTELSFHIVSVLSDGFDAATAVNFHHGLDAGTDVDEFSLVECGDALDGDLRLFHCVIPFVMIESHTVLDKEDRVTESATFLKLLNTERVRRGLLPLAVDPALQKAAKQKALDIVKHDEFSHTVKGVSEEQLRLSFGYPLKFRADEVICWSESKADDALAAFFGSKTHREVLLDRRYNYVGVSGPTGNEGVDRLWGTWAIEIGEGASVSATPDSKASNNSKGNDRSVDKQANPTTVPTKIPAVVYTVSTPLATGKITRKTPFRQIGPVSLSVFRDVLAQAKSPVSPVEEVYRLAGTDSALLLTQMARESTYGTSQLALSTKNPLGLKLADNSGFCSYGCWSTAVAEWRYRISSPGYKDGVYFPEGRSSDPWLLSLEDYLTIYVGGPACLSTGMKTCANGETSASINQYIDKVVDDLNRYLGTATPPPSGELTFGLVPNPGIINRIIPGTVGGGAWVPVGQNSAWDNLGVRTFKGIVLHIMEGTLEGTDAYFRNQARMSALTDFGVGISSTRGDGAIYQWNALSANRAGWASGPANGLEGDGPAFVEKYGVNAINRDLRSIEIAGYVGEVIPDIRIRAVINLMAYLADQAGISYKEWPFKDGLTLVYAHLEFAQKSCPGPYIMGKVDYIIEEVRKILEKWQRS